MAWDWHQPCRCTKGTLVPSGVETQAGFGWVDTTQQQGAHQPDKNRQLAADTKQLVGGLPFAVTPHARDLADYFECQVGPTVSYWLQ
jgi:hypothetical protein